MTYGNDAREMIELGNKRTFFDLRHFATKTLQFCHFQNFAKQKKFRFLWTGKTKITFIIFNLWKRELRKEHCLSVCLFPSIYLPLWWRVCVLCCVRALFLEKSVKAQNAGCFECPAPVCSPLPLSSYMACYVFGRFWSVGRYAGQNAYVFCVNFAASFCTPFQMPSYHSAVFLSSFCFPRLCNNRARLSKVADLLEFLI